jgi:hypothetical protein
MKMGMPAPVPTPIAISSPRERPPPPPWPRDDGFGSAVEVVSVLFCVCIGTWNGTDVDVEEDVVVVVVEPDVPIGMLNGMEVSDVDAELEDGAETSAMEEEPKPDVEPLNMRRPSIRPYEFEKEDWRTKYLPWRLNHQLC